MSDLENMIVPCIGIIFTVVCCVGYIRHQLRSPRGLPNLRPEDIPPMPKRKPPADDMRIAKLETEIDRLKQWMEIEAVSMKALQICNSGLKKRIKDMHTADLGPERQLSRREHVARITRELDNLKKKTAHSCPYANNIFSP